MSGPAQGSSRLPRALSAPPRSWGSTSTLEAVCIAHQTVAVQPQRLPVALFAGSTSALAPRPAFDLILANLIPVEAQPLLADLRSLLAPDGVLVLSGLMADQLAASEEELARCGFAVERARELEEWAGLVCKAGARGSGSGVAATNLPEPAIRK